MAMGSPITCGVLEETEGLVVGRGTRPTFEMGSGYLTLPMLFGEAEEPEVGSLGEVSAATPNRPERERYSLPAGIRVTLCPGLIFWGEEIPEEAKEEPLFGAVATLSMTAGLEEPADPTPSTVDFVLATPGNEGEEPAVPILNKLPKRLDALRGEEPDVPAFCRASRPSAGASPTGDEDKSGATAGPATDEVVKECGIPPAASIGMSELALEGWVSSGPDLSVLPEVLEKS
jgi:hypothetical protein